MYNDLIESIGERDRKFLPFVNIFLHTCMKRLSVDTDIWANLYLFNFDKWPMDKLEELW